MNTKFSIKSLALGAIAGAIIALSVAAATNASNGAGTGEQTKKSQWKGPKWEYVVLGDIKNGFGQTIGTSMGALNTAGQEGWEAVATGPDGTTLMKRQLK